MTTRERMMKVAYLRMTGHTYVQIGMEMGFSSVRATQLMQKFVRDCQQTARQGYCVDPLHSDREMFLELSRMQDWLKFLTEESK